MTNSQQKPSRKYQLSATLTQHEAARIFRASISHSAKVIYESLIIPRLLEKTAVIIEGKEQQIYRHLVQNQTDFFERMKAADKPIMALGAHIGCFELLAAYCISSTQQKLFIIGRTPNNPNFAKLIRNLREGYGGEIIFRDDPHSAAKLIRVIKSNLVVGALIDQDVALKHQFSPFFDLDAAYPQAPLQLAVRYEMPVYSLFSVRDDDGRHKIVGSKIDYNKDDPDAISKILCQYNRNFEETLTSYPEQWFWWHRRWRHRPGIPYDHKTIWPPTTKEYLKWLESL